MEYKELFKKAQEKNITNIQITERHNIGSSVNIIDGEIQNFKDYNNISYNTKAEYKGKTVSTYSNYLDESILDLIIMKSEVTDSSYTDEYLENRDKIEKNKAIDFSISEEIKELKRINDLKNTNKLIDKLSSYFMESYTNTRIINSKGVDISTDSHLCSLYVDSTVKNKDDFTCYGAHQLEIDKSKINIEESMKDAIEKSIIQSNKKTLETKKYDIILKNDVVAQILSYLSIMLSSDSIRKKVSCLENKLDKKIFSDKLTIIEDPTNKDLPGYRLFDDEGTLTKKKTIIEKGVLKNYLYNIKEAKIKEIESTGNGYGNIETRNMYVKEGNKSFDELLKDLKDGVYITDYMGSSNTSINTVNGDISIQIFGFVVEDGKIVSGIEPSIMTTTIFELFSNIEEIGNDTLFMSPSVASPSIYIKNISIAR